MKKLRLLLLVLVFLMFLGSVSVYSDNMLSQWAVYEVNEAIKMGLITFDSNKDYTENISRIEFAELIVSLYEILKGEVILERKTPFVDCDDDYVTTAYSLGLIKGVGNKKFAPNQLITREQIAVMMHNLLARLYIEQVPSQDVLSKFDDCNSISSWAKTAVSYVSDKGLMNGYKGGYHPKENASREVAIIVALRLAKKYLDNYGSPITVKINDKPWELNGKLKYDGTNLWLPASEIMELLGMVDISLNEDYISGQYQKDGKLTNAHFSVGGYRYYLDTEKEIYIEGDSEPYLLNNEIYITENMIENLLGDVLSYDDNTKTLSFESTLKKLDDFQLNLNSNFYEINKKKANELVDTRISSLVSGIVTIDANTWKSWADGLKDDGFTRSRITVNFSEGPVDYKYGFLENEISDEYIELYSYMKDLGIKTRYSLNYWDILERSKGGEENFNRLSTESELDRYLKYVEMVVSSLKGKVYAYEFWNEPNANYDVYQYIAPKDYINMARECIKVIRRIDPEAKIVYASTCDYLDLQTRMYSDEILDTDLLSQVDAISLHTVNNDASPSFRSDYYYGYINMWEEIMENARNHGFDGEFIADELNYRSFYSLDVLQPEIGNYNPYEPIVAAKYIGRMIAINRGLDITVGTSGTNSTERIFEGKMIRNLAYLMEDLLPIEKDIVINSKDNNIDYYFFEDKDENTYIILWQDGVAKTVSDDFRADIEIKDFYISGITIYDPLYEYMQEIEYTDNSNGVMINDLLVKDYPVVIKLWQ